MIPRSSFFLGPLFFAASLSGWAAEIIGTDAEWRYLRGYDEASAPDAAAWRQVGYSDEGWTTGQAPFYYAERGNYVGNTALWEMRGSYTCVYMRRDFQVENVNDVSELRLSARSDDGFIAWINGEEVVRYNMPPGDVPYWGSSLPALSEPIPLETYVLTNPRDYLRSGENVIAIQAFNSSLSASSDFFIEASLATVVDATAPLVLSLVPPAGATVRELVRIEVDFSEAVTGVEAADLLINGEAATGLEVFSPTAYVFEFVEPGAGTVQVEWRMGHGIQDLAGTPNGFGGGQWEYEVDPDLPPPGVIISEFMASNNDTLNDEDGDASDWIELLNLDVNDANLNGWYLTDAPGDLGKWRIPAVTLPPGGYLLVYASGKDRSDPGAPLHANFRLGREGGYLALVDPGLNVVSVFEPSYPPQETDISYGRDRFASTLAGYFLVPTPGGPNASGGPGFAPPVEYSRDGGAFTTSFELTLSAASPGAVIRYTLDGSLPTESSTIYDGPILIDATVQVRARAFEAGLLAGTPRSEGYLRLASSLVNFSSNLPLVVLHNFGAGGVPANVDQPAYMVICEPAADGRSSLTNAPEVATRVGMNLRGRSTQGFPKSSYAVEVWDEDNEDRDLSVLGMPAESDWVFYAPNQFDLPLIHNPFIYQLSNEMGRYAPRARLVEVFVNTTGGTVSGPAPVGDYAGIYVLMEKIKRSAGRVALERLVPEHNQAPQVTGGYLLKVGSDLDADERWFNAAGLTIGYQYPSGPEMMTPQRAAQAGYIRDYFDAFYGALTGPAASDPETGYRAFIDVESWIDHHLLNVVSLNVDALRLSAYFFKDRERKIEMGPIWDFDRSMGTSRGDTRPYNPRNWRGLTGDEGTDFFNSAPVFSNPWYSRLFEDIEFWQLYVDRYQGLRSGVFSNAHVFDLVDYLADQVREGHPREVSRWEGYGPSDTSPRSGTVSANGYAHDFSGTYEGEIDFMKRWLGDRMHFMDTNFLARPVMSHEGGPIESGLNLVLSGPAGATIYYTLNGTDPRAVGGGIAPGATSYTGPIVLSENARVVARARDLNHRNLTGLNRPPLSTPWSGRVAATFVVETPPLVVTELMYHPAAPPPGNESMDKETFEYVELMNRGAGPLNVGGIRFTGGIDFVFPDVVLQGDARLVLAKDPGAFESRYGAGVTVFGPYDGQLDNGGERLTLEGRLGEPMLDFSYADDWYPVTDGHGFSLVIRDAMAALSTWSDSSSWRPSGLIFGTPGGVDPGQPARPVVWINEALTHTDLPEIDAIELRNPGPGVAQIGGWYLTDDLGAPRKFRIPDGTLIPGGGYRVFDANDFNSGAAGSFLLSSTGEELYLFSADAAGELTGHLHGYSFGAALNGVTFGRYVNSVGSERFVAQVAATLGTNNAGPLVGPVVLNELMYHPPPVFESANNERDEFIELHNVTDETVWLYDPAAPTNTWRLRGGVDFDFPMNEALPPRGYLIVVGFDPDLRPGDLAAFRAVYGLSAAVRIVGPYSGLLENSGERVRLLRPDVPQLIPGPDYGQAPYVLVDEVAYSNRGPWPERASATGPSLQRLASERYGDDPSNWQAAVPTPGAVNVDGTADQDSDGLPDWWEYRHGLDPDNADGDDGAGGDPDADGVNNRDEHISGTDPRDASSYLRIDFVSAEGGSGGARLGFQAAAGCSYSVLYRRSTDEEGWQKLADVPARDHEGEVYVMDPEAASGLMRVYRLVTPALPTL